MGSELQWWVLQRCFSGHFACRTNEGCWEENGSVRSFYISCGCRANPEQASRKSSSERCYTLAQPSHRVEGKGSLIKQIAVNPSKKRRRVCPGYRRYCLHVPCSVWLSHNQQSKHPRQFPDNQCPVFLCTVAFNRTNLPPFYCRYSETVFPSFPFHSRTRKYQSIKSYYLYRSSRFRDYSKCSIEHYKFKLISKH